MGNQKSKFEEKTENMMAKKRKKTKYNGQKEKEDYQWSTNHFT
jgi:hypothetical protein